MIPGKTIVVMDDDREIGQALCMLLQSRGYQVYHALDGQTGLDLVDRHRPHLVITDMLMPQKSGFAVIDHLRSQAGRSPRIIMISGTHGLHHQAYAEILGADACLHKPFDFDDLIAEVQRLCPLEAESAASLGA